MAKKFSNPAKQKAWLAFSPFIRLRDCLATLGSVLAGNCITCGRRFLIKGYGQLQAGHAIAGRRNAVLFDEELVHAQCTRCNELFNGKLTKYKKILIAQHEPGGQEWWDKKIALSKTTVHNRDMDFEGREKEYKRRYAELMNEHGHYTLIDRLTKEIKT